MSIPWDAMGRDLTSLVQGQPARLVDAVLVSPLAPDRLRRCAFRLRFSDGRLLKGRRLETARQAETVWQLSAHLDSLPIARPIARHGDALLEEWLPGAPISPELTELREAGTLLGRVHRIAAPGPPASRPLDERWIDASLDVHALVEAGLLESGIAEAAARMARAAAPGSADWGLCHGDFCAENLLRGPGGELCLIDNETVCELWQDFDLARAWYRWPMTPARFAAFLEGYRSHRAADAFLSGLHFWVIAALVRSAQFRLRDGSPADVPIGRLVAFVTDRRESLAGCAP